MKHSHWTSPIAGLGLFLLVASAQATDSGLQHCISQAAEDEDFSGVITASERNRPLVFLARGNLADNNSAQITARTRFNLGSASKMFTAIGIAQMIDAGKVRIDDPIGRFIAGLTPEASRVTIKQLLTHSSGLGDFFKPQNMTTMMNARTASDILPLIADDRPAFTPGSRFQYSNSGFALLGMVIERVSGLSYGDYLARHVFAPAGTTDTGPDPRPLATLAVGMTAFQPDSARENGTQRAGQILIRPGDARTSQKGQAGLTSERRLRPTPDSRAGAPDQKGVADRTVLHPAPGAFDGYGSPAGGLFSTVIDMQRFANAFMDLRLTSRAMAAALTAPQIVVTPATATQAARYYGYGFGVGTEQGKNWFGHNGGTLGANTEFAVFPEDQLVLTVLSNRDPPMASKMYTYLRSLVLNHSLPAACRNRKS